MHIYKHILRERTSMNPWGCAVAERPGNALTATYTNSQTSVHWYTSYMLSHHIEDF